MKFSDEFWYKVARDMNNAKNAADIVRDISRKTGMQNQAIYRKAKKYGYTSGKKPKTGAGQIDPELLNHILGISYIYNQKVSPKGDTITNMTVELARDFYLQTQDTPPKLPKLETIREYLRKLKVSKKDTRTPAPHKRLKSLFANHIHQMDLSIPRFYFDATGKITPIGEGEDYKNKVFEFDTKKKVGLQRWLLVDHLSGAFFVWYSLYHKTVEVAEFLFKAWEQKGDGSEFPFHGLPEALIIDNDKSLRSRAMLQMFEYLGVLIPDVTPYKARIKGTVENFHYQWERWFEPRFLHEKIMDIDEINRLAFQKAIEYQSTRIHGRHGKTRFDKWMERVENLRELPPYPLYQSLLHGVPESRVVDGEGAFSFRSQKYVLKGISHTKVDVSIHPYKYQKDMTVTVQYPSRELNLNNFLSTQIQTFSVNPVYKDQDGFYQGNPVWLVDHVPEQITEREINKEKAKKIGEALDITKIKPFKKRPEANKKFIPKTGTPVIPVSDIVIGPEVYNTTQARMKYKDILGRRLNATEKKALDAFLEEKDQVTSADLKTFIETSSQTNEGLGA